METEKATAQLDDEKKPEILNILIKTEIKEEYDPLSSTIAEVDDLKDEPALININEIKTEKDLLGTENETKYNVDKCDFTEVNIPETNEINIKYEEERPAIKKKLCPYCNLLINAKKIKVHIMGHTGERPYKCTLCDSGFKEKYNLSVHMKTHTGERNIPCPQCDKMFIVLSALTAHMRTHSKEKPYVCNICGKGFSHRANLKPHMTTHSEEMPFMCQDCGKHFRNRKGLIQHTKVHHTNCKNESCEFCLRYNTKKDVPRVAQKQYEKLRECPICLQIFKYYTTYKNHMRMHNNENFQCGFCDKTYIDRAALRTHLRKHTGEMPFQCEVCGRRFTRRDSYKYHLSTHSEVRKMFYCDVCNQGFTHKSSVFKHKRQIHSMDSLPFRCTFCPRSFQSQEFLDSHVLKVHAEGAAEKIYDTCKICDRNFEKRGYTAHMKKHGISIFRCRKCKGTIEGEEAFKLHKKSKCIIVETQETEMNFEAAMTGEDAEEEEEELVEIKKDDTSEMEEEEEEEDAGASVDDS